MATTVLMSGAAFDQLPYEEGRKWELVEGELIPVASAIPEHQFIVNEFIGRFWIYFRDHPLGITLPDSEFALGEAVRLRPDLAVLLSETWAKVDRKKTPIALAPEIAIEVLSPSELTKDSLRKVWIYLGAGTREVWQVSADDQRVVVYHSDKTARVLETGDRLGTPLLPGWEIGLSDLFRR